MKGAGRGRHLLVFARNPIPGQVKTRLIPSLGVEPATAVYRQMLVDTLVTCSQVVADQREVWIDQPPPDPVLAGMAAQSGMSMRVQSGGDLGTRMHGAFSDTLQTACSAVLIGTDCPEYDRDYLEDAFQALGQYDAVLGPAVDGGYVLIGLKSVAPGLFQDIPWGTDRVLAATRHQLQCLQWSWLELPARHDVDHPQDLSRFPHLAQLAKIGPGTG